MDAQAIPIDLIVVKEQKQQIATWPDDIRMTLYLVDSLSEVQHGVRIF